MAAISKDLAEMMEHMELLVDAMSDFAVSAVTGDFTKEKLTKITQAIAKPSQRIIAICQGVATKTKDKLHQNDIIEAMTALGKSIKGIVSTFTQLMSRRDGRTEKLAFANAAKDLGDAISTLIEATDATSEKQILRAVRTCIDASRNLSKNSSRSVAKDKFLTAMATVKDTTEKLHVTCEKASLITANLERKSLFQKSCTALPTEAAGLRKACRDYYEGKGDKEKVEPAAAILGATFKRVVKAAKMPSGLAGKMHATFEYLRSLIEKLEKLQESCSQLFVAGRDGKLDNQTSEAERKAAELMKLCRGVLEDAEKVANATPDQNRAKKIRECAAELRDAVAALGKAAAGVAAVDKRTNPEEYARAQRRLAVAFQRAEAAATNLLGVCGADQALASAHGRMADTAARLEEASARVVEAAAIDDCNGDKAAEKAAIDALIAASKESHGLAAAFEGHARRAGAEAGNETVNRAVCAAAAEARALVSSLIKSGKACRAAQEGSAERQQAVSQARKVRAQLLDALERAQRAVAGEHTGTDGWPDDVVRAGDGELVRAAKAQARQAKQLCAEATLSVDGAGAQRRKAVATAVSQCKPAAGDLIAKAYELQNSPQDSAKAAAFDKSQSRLGECVAAVVDAAGGDDDAELRAAADAVRRGQQEDRENAASGAIGDAAQTALGTAKEVLDELLELLAKAAVSGEDALKYAKRIAELVKQLASQLNALAEHVTDPDLKQQLIMGGKIAKDKALQIKIVAAVQASSNSATNPVGEVARALCGEVKSIVSCVQEVGIKSKSKAATKQATAITDLCKAFRKAKA